MSVQLTIQVPIAGTDDVLWQYEAEWPAVPRIGERMVLFGTIVRCKCRVVDVEYMARMIIIHISPCHLPSDDYLPISGWTRITKPTRSPKPE